MSKRAKLAAIAVAVVLALTVGLTTFVLAQEGPVDAGNATESSATESSTTESPRQTFTGRVAEILGVEEGELIDALKQAREEMKGEAVDRCLRWAIENECIYEEGANEIREWRESLPEALEDFGNRIRLHLKDAWGDDELHWRIPCR